MSRITDQTYLRMSELYGTNINNVTSSILKRSMDENSRVDSHKQEVIHPTNGRVFSGLA